MKPVILFDLDGTLIDSTEAILEGFRVAFTKFGDMVPHDEAIKEHIGHTLEDMFRLLGTVESSIDEHVLAYKMHYRTIHCEKTYLIEGAKEAVERASEFATLGVVTTKTGQYSTELLEHLGLMHRFEVLIGREHVEFPKPHAEPILKALVKLEHDKSRSWMIGDTTMDILSAHNAGIQSIAVTSGYGSYETLQLYASNVCNNALSAVEFIKNYDSNKS
ncbi:MAG: HAD family hydrolase [Campylobacterales bacterium]|nr:HAD family hydrolase [Campylobacterales bacterium]